MERLSSTYAASPLLFWILGSVLLYAVGTNLRWLTRSNDIWRSPYTGWAVGIGRFLFFLGIPYLALGGWPRRPYQGLLSPQDLGIVGLDTQWPPTRWLGAAGVGLGLGLVTLFVLALAWRNANRANDGTSLRFPYQPRWLVLLAVVYLEVHWAFYRSALVAIQEELYTGVLSGLALVYLEWALDPAWRRGWRQQSQAAYQWLRVALPLLSALTFLLTRNLWVSLVIHGLLTLCLSQVGRVPTSTPTPAHPFPTGQDQSPQDTRLSSQAEEVQGIVKADSQDAEFPSHLGKGPGEGEDLSES